MKALLAAVLLLAGGAHAAMGPEEARHLLVRTGFEARIGEVEAFARLTRAQAVTRLLAGARVEARTPLPPEVTAWVTPREFRRSQGEERRRLVREAMARGLALKGWWIGEMLHTDSPLTERMTLFWHNHFTSSLQKVRSPALMAQQNAVLRAHALGSFRLLLHAASKDPAMLVYLDVAQSRRGQPNENFAREVMELFTLGEGRYAEADIREAARAFTGWSVDPDSGGFLFRRAFHDDGEKTVLGASGAWRGEDVLEILLAQPATAEHVVAKLWREFVSPQPDPAEVHRIASLFRAQYEIREAVRAVLLSPAFWAPENRAALIKSPVDLVIGTLRQFDVRIGDPLPFALLLRRLGQDLFAPPNVRGWPGGEHWINSQTLLARKQFVERLMRVEEQRSMALDFSAGRWLAAYEGREQMIRMTLLAAPPVSETLPGGGELVRALVSDPVYQLK